VCENWKTPGFFVATRAEKKQVFAGFNQGSRDGCTLAGKNAPQSPMKMKYLSIIASLLVLTAPGVFGQSPILNTAFVNISNGGTFSFGSTTALLDDSGDFTMAANSQVIWPVDAAGRFAGYSGIDVDGTTSFDPTAKLTLNLINGYSPQDGASFELFHFFGPVLGTPQFNVPA